MELTLQIVLLVFIFVISLGLFLDLFFHISRYRKYIRDYPSTKDVRGRVWKMTR